MTVDWRVLLGIGTPAGTPMSFPQFAGRSILVASQSHPALQPLKSRTRQPVSALLWNRF